LKCSLAMGFEGGIVLVDFEDADDVGLQEVEAVG
jgi:hypothetical protein